MSEATRTRRTWRTGRTRARALGALVLVWTLGLLRVPRALAEGEAEGTRLVEIQNPLNRCERLDCQGAFCLWRTSLYNPCSGEYCRFEHLYITDREDRVVSDQGSAALGPGTEEVRFIAPRQIEFLDHKTRFNLGTEVGTDSGVDPSRVQREVWNLSSDGKTLTRAPKAVRVPDWKRGPTAPAAAKRPPPPPPPEKPSLKAPVSEALLAQARAVCESRARYPHPLHHECHRGTCVLVLDSVKDREEHSNTSHLCTLLVKGSQVRRFPVDAIDLELTPTHYVFTHWDGPYGSRGSQEEVSRIQPETMNMVATQGLHVEGSDPYPVREAKSFAAARALAPTVHAYTRAHIPWGRKAWRDERDLALAWQAMRVGEDLRLHVEVDDDLVLPFTTGTGVHSDHLEFTVSHGLSGSFKLGVLLAPGGQLQVRLWEMEKGDKKQSMDEPLSGTSGTWRQGEHGYEVDLTLALAAVQAPSSPLSSGLSVFVSDADKAGRQETLMGHAGRLFFWTEYPPSLEEYERAHWN